MTADAVTLGGTAWQQVPAPPAARLRSAFPAWLLAAVPLVLVLGRLGYGVGQRAVVAVVIGVVLAASGHLVSRRRWFALVLLLGAGAAVVAVVAGPRTAVLAILAGAGWAVVCGSVLVPGVPGGDRAFRPLIGPLAVASVLMVVGDRVRLPGILLAVAAALAVLLWASPGVAAGAERVGERVGGVVAVVFGAVAMVPALLVLSVMWLAYRIVRFDPLDPNRERSPRWTPRIDEVEHPERSFTPSSPTGGGAWRRRLAGVVVLALAGLGVVVALTRAPAAPRSDAFAHDRGWPRVWDDQVRFSADPEFDNTTVWRLRDFRSENVNQVDGRRATWTPPECGCRRYTVWWFGGSAAWGYYQRDDDTIPSQLARLAWEQGVALDIQNLALPGHSASQEVQLFAQLSATSDAAPDLAVFYDGANELFLQEFRNNDGRGADESPASYAEDELDSFVRAVTWPQRMWPWRNDGRLPADPSDDALDAPQVAHHAVNRYARQLDIAARLGDGAGIPTMFVWQPTMSAAPAAAVDEWEPMAPPDADWHRRLVAAARSELPTSVLDLSDAFDDLRTPVFPDFAHTNERGSGVVARALLDSLAVAHPDWALRRNAG